MQPRLPKVSVSERATRYCAKLDPTVCGTQSCHLRTYQVACVLVQAFALSPGEAMPTLMEWAGRGTHRWSEADLRHKLQSALAEPGFQSRGGLMERGCFLKGKERKERWQRRDDSKLSPAQLEAEKAKRAEKKAARTAATAFNKEKLVEAAGEWAAVVNLVWLANRSAMDPALVTAQGYLKALYKPGEKVIVMDRYDQGFVWPDETIPEIGRDGIRILANPVTGEFLPNPRGKPDPKTGVVPPSRRIVECVTAFRYLVLESDRAELRDWLGFIVQAPLRISAIYTSGGRSIHTLVRLDCRSRTEYEAEKARMAPFLAGVRILGVDPGPMQPLAPSRLPGCWREGKITEDVLPDGKKKYSFFPFKKGPKLQKLLYLQPNPDGRPLTQLPSVRDVEANWCKLAAMGISDADETGGKELLAGLAYYANTSKRCLEALRSLRKAMEDAA